jgi:plastocyanin
MFSARKWLAVGVIGGVALGLGGAPHVGRVRAQAVVEIDMINNAFAPGTTTIAAGDTVLWVNAEDPARGSDGEHDVVDGSTGNELSPDLLNPGDSFSFEFDTSGVFNYLCDVHQNMNGTIVVQ